MSAEIKILIDSFSDNASLKEGLPLLEGYVKHLSEIDKIKTRIKKSTDIASISRETIELKKQQIVHEKLKAEIDKQAAAKQKAAAATELANRKILISEQQLEQQKNKTALSAIRVQEAEKKAADQAQRNADKTKRQGEAYAQLSAKHRDLVREAKNLAAAYGVESKAAQNAAQKANVLDKQLKQIDANLGQHQRNVGNYASAWSGLNGVLGSFGIALSAGSIVHGLSSTIESFVEAEKNARALSFAIKNVRGEGEIAFQKLIKQSEELQATGGVFSDDEIQQAQTQLVNYGLFSNEVEALMPKILDLATVQGVDLATATDTVIKGINGQTKGLKTVGLGFKDTGDRAKNYEIILDGLSKFEGAAADAATTTEGRYKVLQNRFDDLKEDIGEYLINEGFELLQYWDVLSGKIDFTTANVNNFRAQMNQSGIDQKFFEMLAGKTPEEQIKGLDVAIQSYHESISKINQQYKNGEISATAYVASIKSIEDQIKSLEDERSKIQQQQQNQPTFEERTGQEDEQKTKEAVKKAGKSAREIEYEKYIAKRDGRNKQEELDAEFDKKADDQRLADIEARRKENEEILAAQEELQYQLWLEEKANNERIAEERKKAQQEQLKHIEEFGNKVISAAEEKSQRELDTINKQISEQDKMVDIQRRRAEQGLQNDLAFEEKRKAELERAAIAEQKKQEKLKKAEAYWTLLAKFAESDGDQAAQKAALELAEGIAIQAAFAEKGGIGEDLKDTTTLTSEGWSKTHGSGDVLTMISPKEGVLTEQNIAALGGKDGFYQLKHNLEQMANNPIDDDLFGKQNESFANIALQKVVTVNMEPIIEELRDVKKAIRNIPQNKWEIDSLGNYIHTIQKEGSRVITDKGKFIKPQRKKFID